MEIEEFTLPEWADALPNTGFEVFHTEAALQVLDRYEPGELRLFGGYRGNQLVAMLPTFVRDVPFATIIASPPPGLSVPRMGPILMPTSPKRSKQEKVNREFTEAVLESLDSDDPLTLFGMVCDPTYTDPRPYEWAGYDVETRFSYSIELADQHEDDVIMSFSKDARTNIRDAEETGVEIQKRGVEAAGRIYDGYRDRLSEQDIHFPTPRHYTQDLVAALDDHARVYVIEDPDGEFLGGCIVLYSNDTAYAWIGGMPAYYDDVNMNSLMEWRIIEDILTDPSLDPVQRYDLGNANIEHLSRYKSKYNPDLVPHYEIKSGALMTLARRTYQTVTQHPTVGRLTGD